MNPTFQLTISSLFSFLILSFLVRIKPFETKTDNFLEILNESTHLLLSYLNYLFTDFIIDIDTKSMIGWLFIGIIGFNIGINFLVIFS